ncbi:MAG: CGNR zinc finger domain-containing protein [Streptosporangiaceae bacterium]
MRFSSHLDTIVAASVGLVNALTPGEARGRGYLPPAGRGLPAAVAGALSVARGAPVEVAAEDAEELQSIAAELRTVFEAVAHNDVDTAARQVNKLLAWTGARPWLDSHDEQGWHLHFHGSGESMANGWAAGCATGLAVVLGTEDRGRLGVCTAPRCDRVYVDTSRNGTRRFCSTTCQNRVKTAAFRSRQG